MTLGWPHYLGAFVGASILSLVLTPVVLRFALRKGVLDLPGAHKSHSDPVPYLGGLAIVGSFVAVIGSVAALTNQGGSRGELIAILGVGVVLASMGLLDDLRSVPVVPRLIVEIFAGLAVVALEAGVSFTRIGWFDTAITVLWVVGLINAVNMTDNMDGLSSGLVVLSSLSFFAIAAANGQYLVATLSAALAGCALGFLRLNIHPARIYMGDAGAYFLGFLTAYLGLKIQFRESNESTTFAVPVIVCIVLIFDATMVTLTRLFHRLSPFKGGRDHTSHRLVKVGLPIKVAVGAIHVVAASAGVIAFVVSRVPSGPGWVLSTWVLLLLVVAGSLLSFVPVYESSTHALYKLERQSLSPKDRPTS